MQDETHISDIANEFFGIQSQLIFQFFNPGGSSILEAEPLSDFSKECEDFTKWLTHKGYHISEINRKHNLYYEIVFNQLIDLEGFINNLEDETKGLTKHNKDNSLNCGVSDGDITYMMVNENGEWKLARQRPSVFYNYRGSGASTSGYAGSSSYYGAAGTTGTTGTSAWVGRGAPSSPFVAVSSGTTGTWSPTSPSIRNQTKKTGILDWHWVKKLTARINGGSKITAKKAGI